MNALLNMHPIEELLHVIKPHRYIAVWRSRSGVQYAAAEPGELLLVLPGDVLRVFDVKIRPLDVLPQDVSEHPRVKWLSEVVGRPPTLRLYQYAFTPLKIRLIQRLDTGAEFYMPTQEPASPQIVVHVVHAHYVAYVSNRRHVYSETLGGAQAYRLLERGQLKPPQVYIHRFDRHRYEIGVKIPIDEEQVRQLISYLMGL